MLLPVLRGIDNMFYYVVYVTWLLSLAEAALWLRDVLDHAAQRRALRAAKEAGTSYKKDFAIPWWHESWLLFGFRTSDAAVVVAHGLMLFFLRRPGKNCVYVVLSSTATFHLGG